MDVDEISKETREENWRKYGDEILEVRDREKMVSLNFMDSIL